MNFAFGKTTPADGASLCIEALERDCPAADSLDEYWGNHPVDGLVLDLDQTLVNDPVRNDKYEGEFWKTFKRSTSGRYARYEGIDKLLELALPSVVLSNRPMNAIENILVDSGIGTSRRRDDGSYTDPKAMPMSFPREKVSDAYTASCYKPSCKGVEKAVELLKSVGSAGREGEEMRIIGLGNTWEDMVAYNAAGIQSALALWGVPWYLKDDARQHWDVGYVFETPKDFVEFLRGLGAYVGRCHF